MKKTEERPFLELGRRIAEIRKARHFSQDDLARISGVAISSVKDIERGLAEGHITSRRAIAGALECSVAEFYRESARTDAKFIPDISFAADLLSKFSSLQPDLQKIALTVLYQDTAYLKGISPAVAREMALEIGRLFQPLQKAGQK